MTPKRSDYFYKLTADQLGVSEELVRDAVDTYWKEIRSAVTTLKHHSIYVKGLGTFKIKHWKLEEVKLKFERMIANNKGDTFRQMAIKTDIEDKINKISNMQEMVKIELAKKQLAKTKRHDKRNLEKQSSDLGGSVQLNIQEGPDGEDISQENEDM